jgi:hypothetical protein
VVFLLLLLLPPVLLRDTPPSSGVDVGSGEGVVGVVDVADVVIVVAYGPLVARLRSWAAMSFRPSPCRGCKWPSSEWALSSEIFKVW